MEPFNFRIVIVPVVRYSSDEEMKLRIQSYLNELKIKLQVFCGLNVISLDILKIKKSDEDDYPEIEELVLQVRSKCYLNYKSKPKFCAEFCSAWRLLFHPNPSPTLVLYENECFFNTKQPSHFNISCENIAFGVLPHDGQFHQYSSLSSVSYVDFCHDIRNITLKYSDWEIIFSYNNIRNIFVNIDANPYQIFFDLCNPPLIFFVERKHSKKFGKYELKHRTITISNNYQALSKASNGYLFKPLVDIDVLGHANVLCLSFANSRAAEEIIGRIHFRSSEKPIHYAHIVSKAKEKPYIPEIAWNHFGCTYLMTAIFRRNYTVAAQATNINNSLAEVKNFSNTNGECLEKALTVVLAALESGKIINYWHAIERQYYYYLNNKDEIKYMHYITPEKCCMIRRITLTPTRQLLWPAEIMCSNRVLRKFDSEYAIRVSFRDDNNSRLSFNAAYAHQNIFDKSIVNPMNTGIFIGLRKYEFLAWSNSQIRDHGIWMYAKDSNGYSVQSIRSWMGDFSHIHCVPKYMARMGQCFSQTEDALSVPLNPQHVRTENDIEGGIDNDGKPYCFSDGIGRISTKLANEVHNSLGHDKLCSAFQIRYGGYKGMLTIDPTLKDVDIVFRKSMKKFDSPQNERLEIAKTSAPISLQLNRPFITILNDLGVRHRTFLKLQENMLRNLTDMLFDEEQAVNFLKSKTPSDIFKYEELSKSGVYLTTEPFFRSLLLALHRHHVDNIKTRANIAIDPSKGRNMLGVLDDTGLLQEGEVFVQFTKDISHGETTRDTKILERTVLVTKNPCCLPGDVRKFSAVNIPQLRHIVDCIVFPKIGSRPHPNMMGGSDLDGDEYAVLWDDDLIFHSTNHPPGDFPSASVPNKNFITVNDMIECLVNYIKNDQVGIIANAHLARADESNILSSKCIAIAKKFSISVDFAKTGVSCHLEQDERPTSFPDFMEKYHKETYKSKKALGKMFRVVKDFEAENEEASITYSDVQIDEDLKYPGWERYIEDATKSRNKYNSLLKTILRNYGIQHEAEVFSGAFTNLHCRFQERKDKAEIEKVVVRCIKRLTKSMREEFLEEFHNLGNIKEISTAMLQKASAWYIISYRDNNAKILSFPWTLSEFLANIKIKKQPTPASPFSPIVLKMDEQIKFCVLNKQLPEFNEDREWKNFTFLCDPSIVKHALRVLLLWAQDVQIIQKPGYSTNELMFQSTFIKLFLHVSEISNYIISKEKSILPQKKKIYSSASLCLEFLQFCLKLRFYNKYEVKEIIPFQVYKYTTLSKQAVVAYHRFAVLGIFQNLYSDSEIIDDKTEMKPFHIESKIFTRTPIDESTKKRAEAALVKYSSVEWVQLREIFQIKKVLVSAYGTVPSIKTLKNILNKKHVILRQLFMTGVFPENNL